MKKLLGIVVLSLLWCNVSYAWKFQEIGISFETYSKSCKRQHFLKKKGWPQFIGKEGEYKIYNCWKTDTIGYGEVQVFKNNILIKNERSLQRPSQGTFDVTTFLIGLSLLTGNTPSTTINTQSMSINTGVNTTGGTFSHDMISGSNRICFYKTIGGEVAITIKSAFQCKPSLNQ